jgi:diguanylate cyclase (GGDEF)-like protein/PAS domain S-box-containing protein
VDIESEPARTGHALQEAEARFRSAFEEAGIGMAIMRLDGRFLRVNRELCHILGRSERELLDGAGIRAVTHPDDLHERTGDFGRMVERGVRRHRRDRRYVHADGGVVWGATTLSLVRDGEGRPLYALGQLEDITARRDAQERAARRAAQQSAVARLSQIALGEQDFNALARATVTTLTEILDVCVAALAGDVLQPVTGALRDGTADRSGVVVDAEHARHTLAVAEPVIVRDVTTEPRFDARALVGRGIASGVAVPVAGTCPAPFGVLALYATEPRAFDDDDVAFLESIANVLSGALRRLAAESDRRHQALHDPLTGLANRALLVDRLRHAVARGRRARHWTALLHLDLDDFKEVNESLGHRAGDQLLRELAPRLSDVLRPSDTLARVGGDEFALVCDGLRDPTESATIAERVLATFGRPLLLGPSVVVPSTSIGIALAGPGTRATAEDLVRDAAVASDRAKAAGPGRYELFDAHMRAEAVERVALTHDLREAIEHGGLQLVYQPLVSFSERRVVGVEALVRWTHPDRGEIAPDRFIPLAEQHGLIAALGRWVLDAALDDVADWRDAGEAVSALNVSVNVSRVQLGRPGLADEVLGALRRRAIAPRQLVVEVTESAVMDDAEVARATLAALHESGVQLALDDFGVGQSSLACLRDLPLDVLKLDRGFITSLASSPASAAIVRAVADMARTLRFPVIAEGIESREQATVVEALGCDMGQGFHYARPVPAARLPAVVARLDARLAGAAADAMPSTGV